MSANTTSFCTFVNRIDLEDEPIEDSYESIFSQYEKVVVRALASSFGLDFLVQDRHGGDVDTVHNVRQIGKDPEMTYKNQQNADDYANRGKYDSADYHKDSRFSQIKRDKRKEYFENGNKDFTDEYTGKTNLGFLGKSKNAPSEKNANLDHIISAKSIHDDAGRVLAGIDGKDLANSPDNFAWTNEKLNKSMGADEIPDYIAAHPELDETTKKNMLAHYKKAKKAYDAKINRVYYTSKKFWKDTGKAAAKLGLSMGLRQALGLVFTEIWFTVKDAIITCKKDGKSLFEEIAKAVKQGLKNAKKKFREVWDTFIEGAVAGVLSSLVTTLANIFFTTAKNIIKIIRETFASLVQASKILFINPDCYALGDRFVAAAKVIATGASVVAASMVNELLRKTPLAGIPVVGDIVPTFCSVLVSGIMSCSFLYLLDHNKFIKKAVEKLNSLPDVDNFAVSLKKQGELLDRYLSELMNIDFDVLEKQEENFSLASKQLSLCSNSEETNACLHSIYKKLGLNLPWGDYANFDSFMNDKNSRLSFA
ncbi:MAG: hypothetical protein IJ158_06265 [Treponema sp.]|nr:hypothetical protein [Treponema sp.]